MKKRMGLLIVMLLWAGVSVYGVEISVITGMVRNAETKLPVADAMVTVQAEGATNMTTIMTDSQGSFRIPQLPMGKYSLQVEAEGYRTYKRPAFMLRLKSTVRVNVDLLPASEMKKED